MVIRSWSTESGLPQNSVNAIAETREGYLWIGTREGLARFDGVSFASFDARNTPEIKNSSITALCADRDGSLWIGTDGGGLLRWQGGVFSRWSAANGLAGWVETCRSNLVSSQFSRYTGIRRGVAQSG